MIDYLELIFYVSLVIGIYLCFSSEIVYLIRDIRAQQRLKSDRKEHRLMIHLNQLFSSIYGVETARKKLGIFLLVTLCLFLFSSIIFLRKLGVTGLFFAVFTAVMPYCYMRTKLGTIRLAASYEAETLISELVNQYKLCGGNIIETIDATVVALSDQEAVSKRALYKMSIQLKTYQTEEDLRQIIQEFVYTFRTEWSKMLCNNIYNAVLEQVNVLGGLEDLLQECKKINMWMERSKKNNMEALAMIKYVGPVILVVFAYMLHSMMGYGWTKILSYQFDTSTGLILIAVTLLVFFVNFIAANLLKRQKYDF